MAPSRKPRAPHQLPRGRHGLSRRDVETNQRERLFDAIVDVVGLTGYAAMSVEQIASTAGVSLRAFYDHFRSKEDAFLAALDAIAAQLVERVAQACDGSDGFAAGVRNCLAAFLDFTAGEPRYADLWIVEVRAAGPAALERRNAVMKAFADMLRTGAERWVPNVPCPDLTAESIVGGIYEVAYARLLEGRAEELPDLLGDLAYSMMQPYIGHEAAKREAATPPRLAARRAAVSG